MNPIVLLLFGLGGLLPFPPAPRVSVSAQQTTMPPTSPPSFMPSQSPLCTSEWPMLPTADLTFDVEPGQRFFITLLRSASFPSDVTAIDVLQPYNWTEIVEKTPERMILVVTAPQPIRKYALALVGYRPQGMLTRPLSIHVGNPPEVTLSPTAEKPRMSEALVIFLTITGMIFLGALLGVSLTLGGLCCNRNYRIGCMGVGL